MQFLKKDVLIVQTPIIMNSTFTVINMLCCIWYDQKNIERLKINKPCWMKYEYSLFLYFCQYYSMDLRDSTKEIK